MSICYNMQNNASVINSSFSLMSQSKIVLYIQVSSSQLSYLRTQVLHFICSISVMGPHWNPRKAKYWWMFWLHILSDLLGKYFWFYISILNLLHTWHLQPFLGDWAAEAAFPEALLLPEAWEFKSVQGFPQPMTDYCRSWKPSFLSSRWCKLCKVINIADHPTRLEWCEDFTWSCIHVCLAFLLFSPPYQFFNQSTCS